MRLTKEQSRALKAVYDRGPIYERFVVGDYAVERPITYRQFRKRVVPEVGGYGAAMVPWQGMWLGIERDGHVHS